MNYQKILVLFTLLISMYKEVKLIITYLAIKGLYILAFIPFQKEVGIQNRIYLRTRLLLEIICNFLSEFIETHRYG